MAAGGLPAVIGEFSAPADWRAIDFLSDLHLSRATPATLRALQQHLAHTPADAVFILGDLFEAWVGDDAARLAGFERECADLLREAAAHRHLAFMHGNRDFLVGPELLETSGVQALHDPSVLTAFGERVLLSHGDLLCLDDVDYQRYRTQVRTEPWKSQFLARPLAVRRSLVAGMREQSRQHQAQQPLAAWHDLDPDMSARWLRAAAATTLLHGHTHRPGRHGLGSGLTRHVLSDWDFDVAPEKMRGDVLRLSGNGLVRVPPSTAPG
ncbi:MAG: UDP-2,3-diacylglucosamine diphosphatase [Burkholderiaceae bacterium]